MIIIDDTFRRISNEASSKGNQRKFYKDGYWIKIDNEKCSEGLAEEFVSLFESCIVNFNYVPYSTDVIEYNSDEYLGCFSPNMYSLNTEFVSLYRLFKKNDIKLGIFLVNNNDAVTPIKNVVDVVGNLTGLNIFPYLNALLYLDTLIINEDRHSMNLGICKYHGDYILAPCFDNGSSLFCVNWVYRKRKSLEENIQAARSVARPFSKFYDLNIQALQILGASPLLIDYSKLGYLLKHYNNKLYPIDKQLLIKHVLEYQLEYYKDKGLYTYV